MVYGLILGNELFHLKRITTQKKYTEIIQVCTKIGFETKYLGIFYRSVQNKDKIDQMDEIDNIDKVDEID